MEQGKFTRGAPSKPNMTPEGGRDMPEFVDTDTTICMRGWIVTVRSKISILKHDSSTFFAKTEETSQYQ